MYALHDFFQFMTTVHKSNILCFCLNLLVKKVPKNHLDKSYATICMYTNHTHIKNRYLLCIVNKKYVGDCFFSYFFLCFLVDVNIRDEVVFIRRSYTFAKKMNLGKKL
uniref:Uncharacterized protein n=1 Tax=Cacopsylla melanoneura TaxID=428564 RepID=A0A8D9EI43_9HEMI